MTEGWRRKVFDALESPLRRTQERLAAERHSCSRSSFAADLASVGIEQRVAESVWDAVQSQCVIADFPIKPEDDLLRVFGLAEEDLDDVVLTALKMSDCRVPTSDETAGMAPVRTILDFARFVESMRRA